ncbi:MAG: double-strand break repair helicase AddA [Rhizobiales bacterium 65-9]|nr:double-strand break repair helicase AddA [Hyphomicrobiales bacterium]OJY35090.1 MAG: double-strand break repair helicase AddA [Rhizobiales bacterium 65-9]
MSSAAPRPESETTRLQRLASDPALSAWVSANAGSGKTEVLVRRVMRLMLAKVKPDEILCLTYTKAAAAEMTNRVFDRLGGWITLAEPDLSERIRDLTGATPDRETLQRARRLFADALETPGGLKIQTIHAFCERLLHLFPFDANAPAHFEVLDDAAQSDMIDDAMAAIIAGRADGGAETADAFARVAEDAADKDFRDLLRKMLDARASGREADMRAQRQRDIARLAATLGVDERDRAEDAIAGYGAEAFDSSTCAIIAAAYARFPGKTNDANGALIQRIAETRGGQMRADLARALFLTSQKEMRAPATVMTAKARAADPAASNALDAEAARFIALSETLAAIETLDRNRALFAVTDAALAHYQAAKARRGALDFADLIEKTRALLANPGIGPWILYKLDSRLSHVLVDEAQDTSDAQWDIIRRLAEEFTAGEGARGGRRTVFAVGDEKQSIYGFQGAAPQSFAETREHFLRAHRDAERRFESVLLKVSFRSTREVLSAVDRVFAGGARGKGLAFGDGGVAPHESNRLDRRDIGFVELWPLITKDAGDARDDYLDPDGAIAAVDAPGAESPVMRLARRIADNCRLLIENGDPAGRPVRPGDIMILVRRRNALFEAIIAALKHAGVPVAGADRLKVAEHIAVRDCLALARAALAPDDDYALACALKSPLIGLDDDDLLRFAPRREGRLIDALRRAATGDEKLTKAAAFLERWTARAALGPFAFFGMLLEAENGRRRLLQRLGAEAGDALDEFMTRALEFERREGASLAAFTASFEASDLDIKRDLDQAANETRVMTVHAAKGLEAPIVILPDTTGKPEGRGPAPVVRLATRANAPLAVWAAGAAPPAVKAGRDAARSDTEDEHRRLLYVALTRARNGLIIAGAIGRDRAPDGSWYAHVRDALEEGDAQSGARLEKTPARDGQDEVEHWLLPGRRPEGRIPTTRGGAPERSAVIPAWARERAAPERGAEPPLSPSRASEAADRAARPLDGAGAAAAARARGRFVHRLLELLPDLPPEKRSAAGATLALRAAGIDSAAAGALVESVRALIEDERFAALFGPRSRGEVSVTGPAPLPDGRAIRVSGVIDRLAVSETDVVIGDYKTGLRPPPTPDRIPERIIAQLALYRALIAPLYPGRRARCVVVWTAGPLAHEIPDATLDAAIARIAARAQP